MNPKETELNFKRFDKEGKLSWKSTGFEIRDKKMDTKKKDGYPGLN